MVVLFFLVFTAILGIGIVVPVLPIYAKELGATGTQVGLVFSAFSLLRLLGMPFVGALAERFGKRIFIMVGLVVYFVASLLYIWVDSLAGLIGVRALHGIGSSMVIPLSMAYVGDLSPVGKEGRYMGIITTSFFLGMGGGPLISGFLVQRWGVNAAFIGMAMLTLVALFIALLFLPRSEPSLKKKGTGFLKTLKAMLLDPVSQGIYAMRFAMALSRGAVMTFLPLLAFSKGIKYADIGSMVGAYILITAFVQWPFGKLADKLSRWKMVVIGSSIYGTLLLGIPLVNSYWLMFALVICIGIAAGSVFPPLTAIMTEIGREKGMAISMTVLQTANSLGMVLGPIISGGLMDAFGIFAPFIAGAIFVYTGATFMGSRFKLGGRRGKGG